MRVSQIIENVLQLSRRETTRQERIELGSVARRASCEEFAATAQVAPAALQPAASEAPSIEVQFDPTHLHQVLWNLCDNALKHAARGRRRTGRSCASAASRPPAGRSSRSRTAAPASTPRNAERIFEPFFTDKAGGTGPRALHLARALPDATARCWLYEARPGGGSIFRIIFADPQRWE